MYLYFLSCCIILCCVQLCDKCEWSDEIHSCNRISILICVVDFQLSLFYVMPPQFSNYVGCKVTSNVEEIVISLF